MKITRQAEVGSSLLKMEVENKMEEITVKRKTRVQEKFRSYKMKELS